MDGVMVRHRCQRVAQYQRSNRPSPTAIAVTPVVERSKPKQLVCILNVLEMDLYPIRLAPRFVERIWGTRDLSPIFGEPPGTELIGEVWLTGDECTVADGAFAGKTLSDLAQEFGRELVGETAKEERRFPLLMKFLFPREKLSVQVHPDDDGAKKAGQPCGKTECWYVLDAKPGAQVGLGLKPGATRKDFERAIEEVRAEELLNWIDVRKGEMIYVDAGTVHAIGPGSVMLETQQNSDTTYRLYDYGRPRELHLRAGLEALKEKTHAGKVKAPASNGHWTELVCSPCFRVDKASLSKGQSLETKRDVSAAQILVATEGSGVLEVNGAPPVAFRKGEVVVVPASAREYAVRGQWSVELLRAMVPGPEACEPDTTL